jgi:hypothetical protein
MKKIIVWVMVAGVIAVLGYFAAAFRPHSAAQRPITLLPLAGSAAPAFPSPSAAPTLDHVAIIVEENKLYKNVVNNPQAPYINKLLATYASAKNYQGVTHPSLPNYLALTSGSTHGVKSDCNPPSAGCIIETKSIADTIEQSGRTWKLYAEDMPRNCYAFNAGDYATKHNPFVYYSNIIHDASRCDSHVVPYSQLAKDLQSPGTTPNYIFIEPNTCNDMHDCSVAVGDSWLAKNVPTILNSAAFTSQRSLLVVTWDEGTSDSNHIPTILAGSAVRPGFTSDKAYDHYSLLHTIEAFWGLPTLNTNDAAAPLMNEFFK